MNLAFAIRHMLMYFMYFYRKTFQETLVNSSKRYRDKLISNLIHIIHNPLALKSSILKKSFFKFWKKALLIMFAH